MTQAEAPALTRDAFASLPKANLSTPSGIRPAAWRVETDAGPVIVKDASHAWIGLRWYTRMLVRREERALEALDGVPRVPLLLGRLDADAFAMECLTGENLTRERFRLHPRAYADAIAGVVRAMNERGVFHLDLHAKGNVLVDGEGGVSVIDFGAAAVPGPIRMALLGRLYRWIDGQAPLKYLARYAAWTLTEDEARRVIRVRRWRRVWFVKPQSETAFQRAKQRLADIEAGRESDPKDYMSADDYADFTRSSGVPPA